MTVITTNVAPRVPSSEPSSLRACSTLQGPCLLSHLLPDKLAQKDVNTQMSRHHHHGHHTYHPLSVHHVPGTVFYIFFNFIVLRTLNVRLYSLKFLSVPYIITFSHFIPTTSEKVLTLFPFYK